MSHAPSTTDLPQQVSEHAKSWNAILEQVRAGSSWSGRERNCVFLNGPQSPPTDALTITPRFSNASSVSGLDFADDGRAIAVVDWDHDGDQDIWLRNRSAPRIRLMQNATQDRDAKLNSIAFRLVGTTCNRDAIGARVEVTGIELDGVQKTLVGSVSAGDAFLSQSTRWVHFGFSRTDLSQASSPPIVTVHWPGGEREVFAGVTAAARYELVQHSGIAKPVAATRSKPLQPNPITRSVNSSAARIVLPGKVLFPKIDLHGTSGTVDIAPGETPLLVTFWTATCPVCRKELQDFANEADEIRSANLDILAVNLDSIDNADAAEAKQADDFLKQIKFNFATATTNATSPELLARSAEVAL